MEKRKRTRAVIAVIAAILIVTSAAFVWYQYVRPLTMQEVLERVWSPGDVRDVEGTITNVTRRNTSYGPLVAVNLDRWGSVVGDPNATYRVGDRLRMTLHFTEYSFNGNPAVWAPELWTPFPEVTENVGIVADAVSVASGTFLGYRDTDASNWTTYRVTTRDGDAYPLSVLNLSLRKGLPPFNWSTEFPGQRMDRAALWIVLLAIEYVFVSGAYEANPRVDWMPSLAAGTSENGTMAFVDSDLDGMLGDGDLIRVRLNATAGDHDFQAYMLAFGGFFTRGGYTSGGKYILQGPRGPVDLLMDQNAWSRVCFRHAGDVAGATVTSTIEVRDVLWAPPAPVADYRISFSPPSSSTAIITNLSGLPATVDGITVRFSDRNVNGLLDAGDQLVFEGLANRTYYSFRVYSQASEGLFDWITGAGHIVGNLPAIRLSSSPGPPPYRVTADVPWWHQELALNRTPTVSLWENSTLVLDNASLRTGLLGSFPNGSLSFTDVDGDAFLSSGDVFDLQGAPGAHYRLEISVLWECRSYPVDIGP